MTEQEFYQKLLTELDKTAADDKQLASLLEKMQSGQADFADSAAYWQKFSELIGSVLSQNAVTPGSGLNEEVSYLMMKNGHMRACEIMSMVQKALDQKQNIHISPIHPKFPEERARQAAHSLEDTTVSEEVIRRRAENAIANIANTFHDDYIQENAQFRQKAGLTCRVSRIGASKCCAWCAEVAGTFEVGREPADFWRRHDNCSCQIVYETQKSRQRLSGNGRSWAVTSEIQRRRAQAIQYKPTVLTQEQAQALEQQSLSRFRGLTIPGKTGIIPLKDSSQNEIEITNDVINNLKQINVFENDAVNQAILNNTKELLREAQNHAPGTEIGKHIPLDLNPENIRTMIGDESDHTVDLGKCKVPAVTIHNHPSGETFSGGDISRFIVDENAKAMYVIGNNGKWYALRKNEDFNWMQFQMKTFAISDAPDFNEQVLKEADNYGFTYYHEG